MCPLNTDAPRSDINFTKNYLDKKTYPQRDRLTDGLTYSRNNGLTERKHYNVPYVSYAGV